MQVLFRVYPKSNNQVGKIGNAVQCAVCSYYVYRVVSAVVLLAHQEVSTN